MSMITICNCMLVILNILLLIGMTSYVKEITEKVNTIPECISLGSDICKNQTTIAELLLKSYSDMNESIENIYNTLLLETKELDNKYDRLYEEFEELRKEVDAKNEKEVLLYNKLTSKSQPPIEQEKDNTNDPEFSFEDEEIII